MIHSSPISYKNENTLRCALCTKPYKREAIRLLQENGEKETYHATCAYCHVSMIISIGMSPVGNIGTGVITDLTALEAETFLLKKSKITHDQVLLAYEALEDNRGKGQNIFE